MPKDRLAQAGVGSWVFVGSLFPSIIFFTAAIVFSITYFLSSKNCTSWINGYLLGGIALAHSYVLLHGFLLLGPPFRSLVGPVISILVYTGILACYNVFGSWCLFRGHEGSLCKESNIYFISVILSILFYLFVLSVVLITCLILCSGCAHCGCLRVDRFDANEEVLLRARQRSMEQSQSQPQPLPHDASKSLSSSFYADSAHPPPQPSTHAAAAATTAALPSPAAAMGSVMTFPLPLSPRQPSTIPESLNAEGEEEEKQQVEQEPSQWADTRSRSRIVGGAGAGG